MRPLCLLVLLGSACAGPSSESPEEVSEIPASVLEDKIRGGLLAQLYGNLNGLPHEFKYIDEPGKVESYVPGLPDGAFTDDDTDIEWVYVSEMAKAGITLIPPARIAELWRANLNSRIWCANLYARNLLDLGIEPPLTGRITLNPWAVFNISAQFVSECFGLVAPGMPQTAARTGIHYTHTAVDGEPIQTTQLFTAMIATAFFEKDVRKIVAAGRAAVDVESSVGPVVDDVLCWWLDDPKDWKATRKRLKEKYSRHGGTMRDRNGYELNTGSIIGALLYGQGDVAESLRLAFNFGWDSDCNAATVGTITGVIHGLKAMEARGWKAKDVYRNTCRDAMPKDETITGFGDKLVVCAKRIILENGGELDDGVFRIRRQEPACVERLPWPTDRREELPAQLEPLMVKGLSGTPQERARSAYFALCLGEQDRLKKDRPKEWEEALAELKKFPNLIREIFNAPRPAGEALQVEALTAGLEKPKK